MNLEKFIRDVPDFPKKGILFKDITTLLQDGDAFRLAMNRMMKKYLESRKIDKVVGIEARGFHPRRHHGLQTGLRLRAGAQARKAAIPRQARGIHAGVRDERPGGPRGRHPCPAKRS